MRNLSKSEALRCQGMGISSVYDFLLLEQVYKESRDLVHQYWGASLSSLFSAI